MNDQTEGAQIPEANPEHVTLDEFRAAIAELLPAGQDVMIHAALSQLGHIEGSVDDIIAAIRTPMGPDATLIMMTDTRSFAQTGQFSVTQPSETGLLTERFRQSSGVIRSCVPMVSFCAGGPRAAEYTQAYHSLLDDTSPIKRLLENDGRILLIGVGYGKCTLYHLAEERMRVPYNTYKEFTGILVEEGREVGPISQNYFVRSDMKTRKDPSIAGQMLEHAGNAQIYALGRGVVRSFAARAFDACCMQALRRDPNAFLTAPASN